MFSDDWMDWLGWLMLGLPVLIALVFVPLIFAAAMWEKHRTKAYGPAVPPDHEDVDIGPYLSAMIEAAGGRGLGEPSIHRHRHYDITVAFWFNPDRLILVESGQGKIFGMATKQTWLYSRMTDGHVLVTTDQFDEGDPSGLCQFKRVANAELAELFSAHHKRLERSSSRPDAFREAMGAEAKAAIAFERGDILVRRGRAQWTDEIEGIWRYTLRGAFGVLWNYVKQLGIALTQFWRVNRSGPGDEGAS